jgi:hypothetical protein
MNNLPINLLSGELGATVDGRYYLAPDGDNQLLASDIVPLVVSSGQNGFTINHIAAQSVAVVTFSTDTFLLGDVDLSGAIDFQDIPAFVSLLISGVFQAEADMDQSGMVNFQDIPPFVQVLISQ